MAETSGFFQAQWDSSLIDPTTGEATGYWDRNYIAQQFADYFKLLVGNGVFGSPTNQLKVIPGTGLSIIVTIGWAYINGFWYYNDENKEISLVPNSTGLNRTDSIRIRYNDIDREITAIAVTGDIVPVRGSTIYDLILANVIVTPNAVSISAANITDTRVDESVCGLVKGLIEVETTADLFAQYQAIFEEWFDTVKDQVTGDLAIRLQLEFEEIQEGFEQDQALIEDYVYNDYIIQEQTLTFVNKVCIIQDAKIKATSLIDVYFTADTIEEAEDCQIVVDSSAGEIILTAIKQPTNTIKAMFRVRVN